MRGRGALAMGSPTGGLTQVSYDRRGRVSLVIMIDGWMVPRLREAHRGVKPGPAAQERVSWKEVKSAVVYRLEDRAANASGRGMLIEKTWLPSLRRPISSTSGQTGNRSGADISLARIRASWLSLGNG